MGTCHWSLMVNVITCIGYYPTDREIEVGDVVVFGGGAYRVDGVDRKDYELFLYRLHDEDKSVHVSEEGLSSCI